jgi:hypothetical protein
MLVLEVVVDSLKKGKDEADKEYQECSFWFWFFFLQYPISYKKYWTSDKVKSRVMDCGIR